MKNQSHTIKKEMNRNLNQLDGAVAAKNNTPQDKMNEEINLYKANLMELLIPAYRESVGLSSLFRSTEHEAVQMFCGLLKNGHANEVIEALAPIARLTDEITKHKELFDEITDIVQTSFPESFLEDGTTIENTLQDQMILKVELIEGLLIDHEE